MTEAWPAVKISDADPIDRAMILKLQCRNIIGYASGHSDAQVSARYLRDFASIVKKVLSPLLKRTRRLLEEKQPKVDSEKRPVTNAPSSVSAEPSTTMRVEIPHPASNFPSGPPPRVFTQHTTTVQAT